MDRMKALQDRGIADADMVSAKEIETFNLIIESHFRQIMRFMKLDISQIDFGLLVLPCHSSE